MKILNLGCGTKASSRPEVINIDFSIYLQLKKNRLGRILFPIFIKGERLKHFNSLPDNIMVWNLAKGIPFASNSIDVVYHSCLLEHIERNSVEKFLLEIKRVLKPGGIQRIVVPDFERDCISYISHISICEQDAKEAQKHDSYISQMIEQSVRKESRGTSQQKPIRRFIENFILGDARKRGENHLWVYDRINLASILITLGYRNPQLQTYNTSIIPNWNEYELDLDEHGNQYKPDCFYFEVQK